MEVAMRGFMQNKKILLFSIVFFGLFLVSQIQTGICTSAVSQSVCGDVEVVPTPSSGVYDEDIKVHINISNNQCAISAFGLDLSYDTSMFSYQGIDIQNCLTSNWSLVDANEISPGKVRVGGYSGSGPIIQPTDNGCLVVVTLKVICQSPACQDGQQSVLSIDSYSDELVSYQPQPAQGTFTFIHCGGDISLPVDTPGAWGSEIHLPVYVSNNENQISDFSFDFLYDPSVLTFEGVARSNATQDWSTMDWTPVSQGRVSINGVAGTGTYIPASSSDTLVTMRFTVECVGYPTDTPIPITIESYQNGIALMCPRPFATDFIYTACPRLGDVNGDGNVTPGDAQRAFEIYLGRVSPNFNELTTSDANCSCPCNSKEHTQQNNCTTPGDAQLIFEHYLGRHILPDCCADYQCPGGSAMIQEIAPIPFDENQHVYALPTIGDSGKRVMVPLMASNPEGICRFGLEMLYPQDMLEYIGLLPSPLTQRFEHVTGMEDVPGIVRVEGAGVEGITENEAGSLCVIVFRAKEGISGKVPIVLHNLDEEMFGADVESFVYVRPEYYGNNDNVLTLGRGRERDGMLIVPVKVNNAFGVKAFGFDVKYSSDKMTFVGVERALLTQDFVALDGNEIDKDVLRIGGYSMSGIQDRNNGILVKLIFQEKETGGDVEILEVVDDLKEFHVLK